MPWNSDTLLLTLSFNFISSSKPRTFMPVPIYVCVYIYIYIRMHIHHSWWTNQLTQPYFLAASPFTFMGWKTRWSMAPSERQDFQDANGSTEDQARAAWEDWHWMIPQPWQSWAIWYAGDWQFQCCFTWKRKLHPARKRRRICTCGWWKKKPSLGTRRALKHHFPSKYWQDHERSATWNCLCWWVHDILIYSILCPLSKTNGVDLLRRAYNQKSNMQPLLLHFG